MKKIKKQPRFPLLFGLVLLSMVFGCNKDEKLDGANDGGVTDSQTPKPGTSGSGVAQNNTDLSPTGDSPRSAASSSSNSGGDSGSGATSSPPPPSPPAPPPPARNIANEDNAAGAGGPMAAPIVAGGAGAVAGVAHGYPTADEKREYHQGIALTCNNNSWHNQLYSSTKPGTIFETNAGNDPFSLGNVVKVTKSSHALARIDISVQPLRSNGTRFQSLEDFLTYATVLDNGAATERVWRVFHKIADQFPLLKCGGYRIAADNLTDPFVFRVVGGEALSRTLQPKGVRQSCNFHGQKDAIGKDYDTINNRIGGSFNNVFNNLNVSRRLDTLHAFSFDDMFPQLDKHRLVIPKGLYVSSYEFSKGAPKNEIVDLLKNMNQTIDAMGLPGKAFRIVTNAGFLPNQMVTHLHIHIGACENGYKCNGQTELAPLVTTCAKHRLLPSNNLHDMVPFVDKNTVATFDIDNVLLTAGGADGQVCLAGAETKPAFAAMSSRTDYMLGLTERGYQAINDTTVQNVRDKLGNDTDGNALGFKGFENYDNFKYFDSPARGFFNQVIFTHNHEYGKGVFLYSFITQMNQNGSLLLPNELRRVVFVDDQKANCEEVHRILKLNTVITESVSFHYTGTGAGGPMAAPIVAGGAVAGAGGLMAAPIVAGGAGAVAGVAHGYPTADEKREYHQGIALTCNNNSWHNQLYSSTKPGTIFETNAGNDPFSLGNVVKVTKSSHALARIDISVQPLRSNGTRFQSLEDFLTYATVLDNGAATERVWRVFHKIADQFPLLKCGGYRIAADNLTDPFVFRVVGGEALSRTLQPKGVRQSCNFHGQKDAIGKDYDTINNRIGGSFNNVFNNLNVSRRLDTLHAFSFDDMFPQLDKHRLVIPKGLYVSSYEFSKGAPKNEIVDLLKNMNQTIDAMGLPGKAFRIVTNAGFLPNQMVTHLHIHIGACENGYKCNGQTELAPLVTTCAKHRLLPSNNLHDMVPFVDKNTVATFDIDNVLLTAGGADGQVCLAGAETKPAFAAMSSRTDYMLGLTERGYQAINDTTVQNVRDKLGNDTDGNALGFKGFENYDNFKYFDSPARGFFNQVIFTHNHEYGKGVFLYSFITQMNQNGSLLLPNELRRVVFVDDQKANCEEVHRILKLNTVITESVSFHYTGTGNP